VRVTFTRGLEWWRDVPGGTEWLDALPSVVEACAERWSLRVGPAFVGQNVSHVRAAELPDGTPAVLKINFPEPESEHEAAALRLWDGRGAVTLLAADERVQALLLERCHPGTPLWEIEDDAEATRLAGDALRRIWHPPPEEHQFRSLREEAAWWARKLPEDWEVLGGPIERGLIDEAVAACTELGSDEVDEVVLHQDFHGGNVLRAEREPWLVIDPKPLVGERAFDAASLLRDRRWLLGRGGDASRIRRRLDLLTDELGVDRERMRRWGIAHALIWGFSDSKVEDDMVESARLLVAAA
jgi:streptomycin 6-kinase